MKKLVLIFIISIFLALFIGYAIGYKLEGKNEIVVRHNFMVGFKAGALWGKNQKSKSDFYCNLNQAERDSFKEWENWVNKLMGTE